MLVVFSPIFVADTKIIKTYQYEKRFKVACRFKTDTT